MTDSDLKSDLQNHEEEKDDLKSETPARAANECTGLSASVDCAVCLQPCLHPVKLPCTHVFCFLCVKGVAYQSKRCAMCRQEIPSDFIFHPNLLDQTQLEKDNPLEDGYQWFYEGRNGWWQYDERTSLELESAYKRSLRSCELLIAGFLYVIDFDQMLQYRRSDPARRRRIKRDHATIPKKGVAGLRLEHGADEPSTLGLLSAAASRASLNSNCLSPSQTPQAPSNTPQTPRSPPSPAPDASQDSSSADGEERTRVNAASDPLLGPDQITTLLDRMIVFYNLDDDTIDWNSSDSSLSDQPNEDAV